MYINTGSCDTWVISYCEFNDNAAAKYQVLANDSANNGNTDGFEVHHCKFTKTTGTGVAGEECCESINTANAVFHDNWVTTCPEDAFEHVTPRTGCQVYDCVGDNVGAVQAGQVVDFFNTHADDDQDFIVRNIYGSCSDKGVIITNCAGVTVSNVHIATTGPAVTLELTSTNCTLFGPFENAGSGVRYSTNANYDGTGSTIAGVIDINSIS